MSGGRMFGRRTRRVAVGMGVLAAAALLAACSPVKMGAAAIVGDQRITTSSLDTQVSNLQRDIAQYDPSVKADPAILLGALVSFKVRDQTARDLGITVSQADIDFAINALYQSGSYTSPTQMIVSMQMPADLKDEVGRYLAVEVDYIKDKNGGTFPTTQTPALQQAETQFFTTECKAGKALGIQVNPQYGQLSLASKGFLVYTVINSSDTLSAAGGAEPAVFTPIKFPLC